MKILQGLTLLCLVLFSSCGWATMEDFEWKTNLQIDERYHILSTEKQDFRGRSFTTHFEIMGDENWISVLREVNAVVILNKPKSDFQFQVIDSMYLLSWNNTLNEGVASYSLFLNQKKGILTYSKY